MNGVKLDEDMIRGLMDPFPSPSGFTSEENSVAGDESPSQIRYVTTSCTVFVCVQCSKRVSS